MSSKVVQGSNGIPKGAIESKGFKEGCSALKGVCMICNNFGIRKLINPLGMRILGTVTHVVTDKPVAALTFDDGPDALYTPKVLDMLGKYDAKATFFMVGHAAFEYPDLLLSGPDLLRKKTHFTLEHQAFCW